MGTRSRARLWAVVLARIVCVSLPVILLAFHPIDSADIWIHLATGDVIGEARALPERDPFGASQPPWVVHDWLAALVLSVVHRIGGSAGLVVLAAGITSGALALPLVLAALRRAVLWPFEAALLFSTLVAYERFFVRPEMFTLLAASIWACALAAGAPRSWRGLALLAFLQVLWTNLHGAFVLGPLLAAAAVLGDVLDAVLRRGPSARSTSPAAAIPPRLLLPFVAGAACLVNPYGVRLVQDIWRAGRELGPLRAGIVEWQPTFLQPVMGDWVLMLFVGSLVAVVATGLVCWRRVRASELLVVAAMTVLALHSRRHVALDAVVSLPLAALWLGRRHAPPGVGAALSRSLRRGLAAALFPAVGIAIALGIAGGGFYDRFGPPRTVGWGFSESDHPVGAGEFVARHGLGGPMFNNVAAGSYLAWRLRGNPAVLVDGRLLDPELFAAYRRCLQSPAEFEAFARARGVRLVVLALPPFPPVRLFRHLVSAPEWRLAYLDGEGAVFVGRETLERAGMGSISLDEPLPAEGAPTGGRGGWPRRCDPGAALRRGRMLLQLGFPVPARADLARAQLHCPERWDTGLLLGTALVASGRAAEAEPLVARALEHAADDPGTWVTYGMCRVALGDTAGAREAWSRARALDPADPRPAELLREFGR